MGLETKKKLVPVDKLNQYLEYSQNEDGILVLRRYIHRDIFTTYNSHHKIPKSINFRESYLVHRDDSWLQQQSRSETEGSADNGDELVPNHHHEHKLTDVPRSSASSESNFTRRRKSLCFDFGSEDKGSGRSSPDDETLSDASSSRDYSPPSSSLSSPKSNKRSSFQSWKRDSVNIAGSPTHDQSVLQSRADLNVPSHMPLEPETCALNGSGNETAGVGGGPLPAPDGLNPRKLYKKLVSKYRVSADNSATPAATGLLQDMVVPDLGPPVTADHDEEFDFLLDSSSPILPAEPTTPPRTHRQSRYGNLQVDPSQHHLAVATKRRSHVSASPESMTRTISSTSCRNSNPSPETIRSTPSSPTAKIDAGIPPVVPKHGSDFQSNAKRTPSPSEEEGGKIHVSRSPETGYTRKCSYRKPKRIPDHFTSGGNMEHQGLGIVNHDDPMSAIVKKHDFDGPITGHKKTPSSFMLPGYNELETKLHVLNPDSRKTSMSSIVPAPVAPAAPIKKRHTSYTDFLANDNEIWDARARAFASRSS